MRNKITNRIKRLLLCVGVGVVGWMCMLAYPATATAVSCDYNGDGQSDMAIYNRSEGTWAIRTVSGETIVENMDLGGEEYRPMYGDYDGDGKTDLAVYHEASGEWYIRSVDGSIICSGAVWGGPGFVPVTGDYDGDGKTDLAIYDGESECWYICSVDGSIIYWGVNWGGTGAVPLTGDFDGDGKTDLAVYCTMTTSGPISEEEKPGHWYILLSGTGEEVCFLFGGEYEEMQPIYGDYDGDGKTDLAVYHEWGYWYIFESSSAELLIIELGGPGYTPASNDYDGDGKADLAVYGEESGGWDIRLSGSGTVSSLQFGGSGWVPVVNYPYDYDPVPIPPNIPMFVLASDGIYEDKVRVTWSAASRASSYEIWRGVSDHVGAVKIGETTDIVYDDRSTVSETIYCYGVKAVNSYGTSDFSGWNTGYSGVRTANLVSVAGDYDGDGKTDLAVYGTMTVPLPPMPEEERDGVWSIRLSDTGDVVQLMFGGPGFEPVPGDYDGDGKTDVAVYYEEWGYWYIFESSSYELLSIALGGPGYTPVSGDYDGDGKADLAVYGEESGGWDVLLSGTGDEVDMEFGELGMEPVQGDFNGDGKSDLAVYCETTGCWYILLSGTWEIVEMEFGGLGMEPVPADFNGDGKSDLAVYCETTGCWYILLSGTWEIVGVEFGGLGMEPVPADFDGDGKADLAVYQVSEDNWYMRLSGNEYALVTVSF